MLWPQKRIAERETGRNAVLPDERKDRGQIRVPEADPAAAPKAIRRGPVDGADTAVIIEPAPVIPVKLKEDPVKIGKLKKPGQMIINDAA